MIDTILGKFDRKVTNCKQKKATEKSPFDVLKKTK